MSAQALNIMLVDLFRSEEAFTRYQRDPDTVAAQYNLTPEEQERLKAKDMGWLYQRGVHPYILAQFALSVGYDLRQYASQLREATGQGEVMH